MKFWGEPSTVFSICIFPISCLSCFNFLSPHCQDLKNQVVLRVMGNDTVFKIEKRKAEVMDIKQHNSVGKISLRPFQLVSSIPLPF